MNVMRASASVTLMFAVAAYSPRSPTTTKVSVWGAVGRGMNEMRLLTTMKRKSVAR